MRSFSAASTSPGVNPERLHTTLGSARPRRPVPTPAASEALESPSTPADRLDVGPPSDLTDDTARDPRTPDVDLAGPLVGASIPVECRTPPGADPGRIADALTAHPLPGHSLHRRCQVVGQRRSDLVLVSPMGPDPRGPPRTGPSGTRTGGTRQHVEPGVAAPFRVRHGKRDVTSCRPASVGR